MVAGNRAPLDESVSSGMWMVEKVSGHTIP
jgi:hypothetical protein